MKIQPAIGVQNFAKDPWHTIDGEIAGNPYLFIFQILGGADADGETQFV